MWRAQPLAVFGALRVSARSVRIRTDGGREVPVVPVRSGAGGTLLWPPCAVARTGPARSSLWPVVRGRWRSAVTVVRTGRSCTVCSTCLQLAQCWPRGMTRAASGGRARAGGRRARQPEHPLLRGLCQLCILCLPSASRACFPTRRGVRRRRCAQCARGQGRRSTRRLSPRTGEHGLGSLKA